MPLHYRGIDNDSHIWRIDTENDFRPSKRQRTALSDRFENYGITCDGIASMSDWKGYEEEEMDSSSSLESTSETMVLDENSENDGSSVQSILRHYIRDNSGIEFLKEGLDRLLDLIGAKNHDAATKQRHRGDMLKSGGHWMISNLLAKFIRESGHESNATTMSDEDIDSTRGIGDETVIPIVVRSCQILRELLLSNPPNAALSEGSRSIDNLDTIIRYQIYCAGGLDVVVRALKRFPTSFEVQLAGCQCLSQLVMVKGTDDNHNQLGNSIRRSSYGSTTRTLIKNLYQSTDQLNVIVRLVGCGMRNSIPNGAINSEELSSTQMWQLFFVVADIVRSVVRHSTPDSSCRAEVIGTVENYLVCNGGRNHPSNDDTIMIEEARGSIAIKKVNRHKSGMGKYMYEYLMTILMDEEDCYENDISISSTYMNE